MDNIKYVKEVAATLANILSREELASVQRQITFMELVEKEQEYRDSIPVCRVLQQTNDTHNQVLALYYNIGDTLVVNMPSEPHKMIGYMRTLSCKEPCNCTLADIYKRMLKQPQ